MAVLPVDDFKKLWVLAKHILKKELISPSSVICLVYSWYKYEKERDGQLELSLTVLYLFGIQPNSEYCCYLPLL